jgi:PAS domain S-box-containing protein
VFELERVPRNEGPQDPTSSLGPLIEVLPVAVYTTDPEGRLLGYNSAAVDLWGYQPELRSASWCGCWQLLHPDGTPMPHDTCPMALAIKDGVPLHGLEAIAVRPDGKRVPFLAFPTPLRDSAGRVTGAVNMLVDLSGRKEIEASLVRRINEQQALFRLTNCLQHASTMEDAYEAALDAILQALRCDRASILLLDEQGVMRFVAWRGLSAAYRAAVEGHSPWTAKTVEPQPISIADVTAADFEARLRDAVLQEGIAALAFVPLVAGARLTGKFMIYFDAPHAFSDDELDFALVIGRQVGFAIERKHSEERVKILMREVNHRSKNLLALVQAVATHTAASQPTDFVERFSDRLKGLAASQDLLIEGGWRGIDMAALAQSQLARFHDLIGTRIALKGPSVQLSAAAAQSVGMALHELAANAGKYGSLSNATGTVECVWDLPRRSPDSVDLAISWSESGGPPVKEPTRHGFGHTVISSMARLGLGAEIDLEYAPAGLIWRLRCPAASALVTPSRTG